MITRILDGKVHAERILDCIRNDVVCKIKNFNCVPCLAVILVGNDFSSNLYVKNKVKACYKVGFVSKVFKFSKTIKNLDLINLLKVLNMDSSIHGILIQLPLPIKFNYYALVENISPYKDVDLLNPLSFGRYITGYSNFISPCTPSAVMLLLKSINIDLTGLTAVVIGTSNIVGKPLIFELLKENVSIIVLSKICNNFSSYIKFADILISAVGKPNFIFGNYIKYGSIIIDVGISVSHDKNIVGDVNFDSIKNIASWITPVPGGVGPVTISKLIENTFYLYLLSNK